MSTSSQIGADGHRKAPTEPPGYPEFRAIEVDFQGTICVVTLGSDPAKANPSDKMTPELTQFFRLVRYDPRVRAIMLQGRGNRFSAGGDVNGMREQATRMGHIRDNPDWVARIPVDRSDELSGAIFGVDVPIVSAITGHAIGAGLGLALYSDVTVMDENAKIGDPHVRRGLMSPGAYMFPALVGLPRAKEMILTGRLVKGAEAERIGLINYAVPHEEVIAKAREIAEDLATLPPLAIRWTKRVFNSMARETNARGALTGAALESLTMISTDHEASVIAWLDKQPEPEYGGH
ncbi:enoyl-CoA hydratase/isomerase family protein [Microbacterium sp. A82]|uniref:enoyl-CoA hydratase/isomerase family protein n=1 Tax=Microbacterium sp. A82 TaxID=3450452 RepID=UPI003F40EBE8